MAKTWDQWVKKWQWSNIWPKMRPGAEPGWSDSDSYILLAWIWVGSRFALALATSVALWQNLGLNKDQGLVSAIWLLGVAITVANGAQIIQQGLRKGQLPGYILVWSGAALDVIWVVSGYVFTGLAPLPFPAFMVALIALHGAFLPLAGVILSSALIAILVSLLQALNSTQSLSMEGQLIFVLGLGIVAGLIGSKLRAAVWAVLRLRRAVWALSANSEATARALPLGMLVLTPEGIIERATGALEGVYQNIELETLHKLLIHQEEEYRKAIAGSLEGQKERQKESKISYEGKEAWIEWSVARRTLPDLAAIDQAALTAAPAGLDEREASMPQVVRTVIVLRDRSDLHRAQEAEKSALDARHLAAMSAGLAHEIRNPLAALRSAAEQLADVEVTAAEDRAALGSIVRRESDRLNRFMEDFLAYARLDVTPGEFMPSKDSIEESINMAKRANPGGQFVAEIEGNGPMVPGDLLMRVVSNLLINAGQHSNGGNILISAGSTPLGYLVGVRDWGPGITPERREKIFSPFYTTRPGGNGLGLSMAARAANLMGAKLWAETPPGCSDVGEGIIFYLLIPGVSKND